MRHYCTVALLQVTWPPISDSRDHIRTSFLVSNFSPFARIVNVHLHARGSHYSRTWYDLLHAGGSLLSLQMDRMLVQITCQLLFKRVGCKIKTIRSILIYLQHNYLLQLTVIYYCHGPTASRCRHCHCIPKRSRRYEPDATNSFARKDAETFPCLSETFGFLANGDELGELFEPLGASRFKKRSMSNNYQAISWQIQSESCKCNRWRR